MQGHGLRGGHDDGPGEGDDLAQGQGDIPGPRWQVDEQHVEITPFHLPHELLGKVSDLPDMAQLCETCETKSAPPEKDDVLFLVESYNNISARQQFSRAIAVLEGRYKTLGEFVKSA